MLEALHQIRNFNASHQSQRPFPLIQKLRRSLVSRRRRPHRLLRRGPPTDKRQRPESLIAARRKTAPEQTISAAACQSPGERGQKRLLFRNDEPTGKPRVSRFDTGSSAVQERVHAARQIFGKKAGRRLLEEAGDSVGVKAKPLQTSISQGSTKKKQVAGEKPCRPDPPAPNSARSLMPHPGKHHARAGRKGATGQTICDIRKSRSHSGGPQGETARTMAHRGSLTLAQRRRIETPELSLQRKSPDELPGNAFPESLGQGDQNASLKLPGKATQSSVHKAHDPLPRETNRRQEDLASEVRANSSRAPHTRFAEASHERRFCETACTGSFLRIQYSKFRTFVLVENEKNRARGTRFPKPSHPPPAASEKEPAGPSPGSPAHPRRGRWAATSSFSWRWPAA